MRFEPTSAVLVEILPVGMPLGYDFRVKESVRGMIRCGDSLWRVDAVVYDLWRHLGRARDVQDLDRWAVKHEFEDARDVLFQWLHADGLAISLSGNIVSDSAHLSRHRLLPIGFGAGNTADSPDNYVVMRHDASEVSRMGAIAYTAWMMLDGYATVMQVIEAIAAQSAGDLQKVYDVLFGAFPIFVRSGCAIFDRSAT